MTATGVDAGSRRAPKTSQHRAVRTSIDQPWARLKGGKAETRPDATATRMIATASRLMPRPMAGIRVVELARLVHPHQAADDRARAGLGLAIDEENSPLRAEACGINTARLQRRAGLGKVVELAPRDRSRGEVHIVPLALYIEPFNHQLSAARGLDQGRKAVERKPRRGRGLFVHAADNGRCAFAGLPIGEPRMT